MNMHHVQRCPYWAVASKECRSEFMEAMRGKEYGASETKDAWDWYYTGWTRGGNALHDALQAEARKIT